MEFSYTHTPDILQLLDLREAGQINDSDFLVGTIISLYAGKKGAAWPKVDTLAHTLGKHTRSILRALRKLEASGFMRTGKSAAKAGGKQNMYYIDREKMTSLSPTNTAVGDKDVTNNMTKMSPTLIHYMKEDNERRQTGRQGRDRAPVPVVVDADGITITDPTYRARLGALLPDGVDPDLWAMQMHAKFSDRQIKDWGKYLLRLAPNERAPADLPPPESPPAYLLNPDCVYADPNYDDE